MKKLIITADDFGMSPAVNKGIIECAKREAITGTSIMANGDWQGIEDILELPRMSFGVHLNLTHLAPTNTLYPTELLTPEGLFPYWFIVDGQPTYDIDDEVVKDEYIAQIEKVGKLTEIHYLDHHHHLHRSDKCFPIVVEVAKKYGLPVRAVNLDMSARLRQRDIPCIERCVLDFFGEDVSEAVLKSALSSCAAESIELVTHPGTLSSLFDFDDYDKAYRTEETKILISDDIKKWISENFKLASYKEFKRSNR